MVNVVYTFIFLLSSIIHVTSFKFTKYLLNICRFHSIFLKSTKYSSNGNDVKNDMQAVDNIWNAKGLSQSDLMHKDECILVDENDQVIGHASKYDSHKFCKAYPSGRLHRAFSIFLFNQENKLLLQKRASTKITFPNVWTNTCCSHPLYGYHPTEVDEPNDIEQGIINGIKNAAIRKLNHELGIDPNKLNLTDFKYLTRLHYSASSDQQQNTNKLDNGDFCWGESEIDYILFIKADFKILSKPPYEHREMIGDIFPHSDEIDDLKYVTRSELEDMMDLNNKNSINYQWSPWFRIICKHFLSQWWDNIDITLNTNTYCNYKAIHKLI